MGPIEEPADRLTESPLTTRDRLAPAPGATRRLGEVLFVSVGGATGSVQRLSGSGPLIWDLLDEGLTIGEAVARLTGPDAPDQNQVEEQVLRFATALVEAGLRLRRT